MKKTALLDRSRRRGVRSGSEANQTARQTLTCARQCLAGPPPVLVRGVVGFDTSSAVAAWQRWADYDGSEPAALADHLDGAEVVTEQVEALRESVAAEVTRRDDQWRPLARDLTAWVIEARAARAADARQS